MEKEFRLVKYLSSKNAARFFGGKAAASPIAYYYHLKKYGKVILGGNIIHRGLGPFHSIVKDYFKSRESVNLPVSINQGSDEVTLSNIGYLYQNNDSLFNFVKNGIYWQFTIDKICRRSKFTTSEKQHYYLNQYQTGLKDQNYWEEREIEKHSEWKVLLSDMRMLKTPLNPINKNSDLLKTYQTSNENYEKKFYNQYGNRTQTYTNTYVFLEGEKSFTDFERKLDFFKQSDLSPMTAIDTQIKNSHIKESLVHEMLKILMASKGWYVNFEIPTKYEGEKGRIDFLIKPIESKIDGWKVIEVKLLDNPCAVEQLSWYLRAIESEVNRNKDYSKYFSMLWDGSKMRDVEGVILCGFPASEETIEESKNKGFTIWTYNYIKQSNEKFDELTLGIQVKDEEGRIILSSD